MVVQRAVRPSVVVAPTTARNDRACGRQVLEPMVVQAFVAAVAVETAEVGVLHRLSRRNPLLLDTMPVRRLVESASGVLQSLLRTNRPGTATEDDCLLEYACQVLSRDTVIDDDIVRLFGEVVDDCQDL